MDGLTGGIPPLVDQHSHGAVHGDVGLGEFETRLAEAAGATGPAPPGTTFFDSRAGLAVRRWCPPLLGLEPHCAPVRYLARRRELGAYRAGRLLLRGAGIGTFLLESSASGGLTSPAELARAADGRAHEVVRLETLAARVADTAGGADLFLAHVAEALYAASGTATAFASGVASCDDAPPPAAEVRAAAGRWLRARRPGETPGDPVLGRYLLWCAAATGLPVQLHCADPRRLTGFLRAMAGRGVDLVLLPDPWHRRQAARLAAVFPHVYADVGARPEETLGEAPFGKLLFSTGARGLAELYVVAARLFVRAMERLMGDWVADGWCRAAEAGRIASLVAAGTARRIYRLDAATG
ncbi:amidohydrolase [Streptomyces triculaminicus]|uniref:Amidohydrolase n=2 Tax=Streptomyces TaxID=1883 RepID=A0A939FJI1_9ACTN|nr:MULTISPECIES: amidohydrolase [Streptomyces]MBO0653165.1 amidohydrolase [Streptomyces triculaminicus]QSY48063.1 amidohydrolase [Streptomyces griseocarneus]